MKSLQELGKTVATRRRALHLRQSMVASHAGISAESLSRFERGRITEFGSRKLLALLAVLEMEIKFVEKGHAGSLDELKKERSL
ncbi:MAG: helix-turn-helix transcriptional regulator [Verrucomicrobiae bacterium]|nr:helix-turn-helix transcriptional regulator [Verrucomicrobiae bacterium]